MIEPLEQFENTLKSHGHSVTATRRLVFRALQNQEPQSMRELLLACGEQVDRASVYRTIALFEQLGIVKRLQIGWKYKLELSDSFHHHHHHLTCLECGIVTPLPEDSELEGRLAKLARHNGFLMREHQLEIQGLCASCQIKT